LVFCVRDQMDVSERIIRLEEKLAFQEQTIAELDKVVLELNRKVSTMGREMDDVRVSVRPIDQAKPDDEKPPHYGGFGSAV